MLPYTIGTQMVVLASLGSFWDVFCVVIGVVCFAAAVVGAAPLEGTGDGLVVAPS